MSIQDVRQIMKEVFGSEVVNSSLLSGGCLADLQLVRLENGMSVVVKQGDSLRCEASMLDYLRKSTSLPVPEVFGAADGYMLMEYLPGKTNALSVAAERHLGAMIADLHSISRPDFGFEMDTVIGPLPQPNDDSDDWCVFFRDRRLVFMADLARQAGQLSDEVYGRVLKLAERLDKFIGHKPPVSLLHGDLWGGNILSDKGGVTGIIDPAIYYGDAEVELAFMTLFGTVGQDFFEVYGERRLLDADFFRVRRDIYLLYPLLVHVRLFGGGYVSQLNAVLEKYL
ncbi:fructosamine kinase family protein [Emcibacter sp.]|uniref:fructosamine kinase family protein n=1 Tax=Emcibacter sp. TaxID=1979954 RepID=UPI002D1E3C59|nr:fructosamine kinase family protein [Emcibacter sp.]